MKCTLVKVRECREISAKAVLVSDYNGNSDVFPKSTVFYEDDGEYWIASWILPKKSVTYSRKREAWVDEHGNARPVVKVTESVPELVEAVDDNTIEELCR